MDQSNPVSARHQELKAFSLRINDEISRLLRLEGNCGRTLRRFIEQSFPGGVMLFPMPVYGDSSHPHFPVIVAEAAVLLARAVVEAGEGIGLVDIPQFFSDIRLESVDVKGGELVVRVELKSIPDSVNDKRALLDTLFCLQEHLEGSIRYAAHALLEPRDSSFRHASPALFKDPKYSAPQLFETAAQAAIEGLLYYEGGDLEAEAYYEKGLKLFLQAYAGDTQNALHLPGGILTALSLLKPDVFDQIHKLIDDEYQQELDAEALMS